MSMSMCSALNSCSGCPPSPLSSYSSQDMLMLRCQQHLSRIVAAAPPDGKCLSLPMLTRINMQPHAAANTAGARLGNGQKRDRRPSFTGSLSSCSDDELGHFEKKRVLLCDPGEQALANVWQPDPLLADNLMEGLDADFWQAQIDLASALGALDDGLDAGFDPCFMAKHAEGAQKHRRPNLESRPPASTLIAEEGVERSSSPCFVGVVL